MPTFGIRRDWRFRRLCSRAERLIEAQQEVIGWWLKRSEGENREAVSSRCFLYTSIYFRHNKVAASYEKSHKYFNLIWELLKRYLNVKLHNMSLCLAYFWSFRTELSLAIFSTILFLQIRVCLLFIESRKTREKGGKSEAVWALT
jgi:hypothetical protein